MASDAEFPVRLQFSLRALLVAILIAGPIVAFLGAQVWKNSRPRVYSKHDRAKDLIHEISAALRRYRDDFGSYPPDNFPTENGSEVINYFLARQIPAGNEKYGPVLLLPNKVEISDSDGNGFPELRSPFDAFYTYKLIGKRGHERPLIIDPGPDKLLGGTIDPEKGFVPDNSDANHDGVPDDQDNITNETDK